jgi:hypothetical protein
MLRQITFGKFSGTQSLYFENKGIVELFETSCKTASSKNGLKLNMKLRQVKEVILLRLKLELHNPPILRYSIIPRQRSYFAKTEVRTLKPTIKIYSSNIDY